MSCRAECHTSGDCPSQRQTCVNNKCIDPCKGVCGINANCRVRDGTTAVCSCPKDMTGDPFVRCRPFEKRRFPRTNIPSSGLTINNKTFNAQKIYVSRIPVARTLNALQDLTEVEKTVPFVLVLPDMLAMPWFLVEGVNANTTVTAVNIKCVIPATDASVRATINAA